jgi:hypothetical protein
MLWSFSRDGGVPGHRLWSSVSPLTGTPVNSVWAMVTFAFLLGLPMLYSSVAFTAVVSISTVGLYISCEPLCHTVYSSLLSLPSLRCLLKVHTPAHVPA